jgi:hypothetical protein
MVAALFVAKGGVYEGLPDVEFWGLPDRDARKYAGPHPVVAHPPCARWCRLAGFVEKVHGHKKGDDGGCFAAAISAVRRFGGVIEHPAYSDAFAAHGISPPLRGGWQRSIDGGRVCHVEQWHYGHRAKKATWLYAHAVTALPSMKWATTPDQVMTAYVSDGGGRFKRGRTSDVSWCGNRTKDGGEQRKRLGDREAKATPLAFRDLLLSIARSAA